MNTTQFLRDKKMLASDCSEFIIEGSFGKVYLRQLLTEFYVRRTMEMLPEASEILLECEKQIEKWGEQNHKPIEWIAILTEEVGEAAKEALDYHFNNDLTGGVLENESKQIERMINYRHELIQVAAVALSMVNSVDRNELISQKVKQK